MEYNILKSIEDPVGYHRPLLNQLQSPFPNKDYVNPGVGITTRLFDVFVPIYYDKSPHCSTKAIDQQGFGELNNSNKPEDSFGSPLAQNITKIETSKDQIKETNQHMKDVSSDEKEIEESNLKKRNLLGNDIFQAFMHPVIKTTKLSLGEPAPKKLKIEEETKGNLSQGEPSLNSLQKLKPKKLVKSSQHKFKVI